MFGNKKFYKIDSESLNLKDFKLLCENGMDINILWQKKSEKISELESQLKKAVVTVKNLQGELTELKENGIVVLNSDEVVNKNILQKENKTMNNEVTQWEYKIFDGSLSSYEKREKEINELGKNGWELIGVDPTHPTEFLFKRGKKDNTTD